MLKKSVQRLLGRLGFELVRKPGSRSVHLAGLEASALHAVYMVSGGRKAAFMCPLDDCRTIFGFGFGARRWHPFSAAIAEYADRPGLQYEESLLHRFYQIWQPPDARSSVVGFDGAPESFAHHPAYAFVPPWLSIPAEERRAQVTTSCFNDYLEHQSPLLNLDTHGYRAFGPVSDDLGKFEFSRCTSIFRSLRSEGYDRRHGDIEVNIIRRGSGLIFISGSGQHRRAAMSALGYEHIPAMIRRAVIIDAQDVDYWPLVVNGTWTRDAALHYIDHLFDFDSIQWAADHNFLRYTRGSAVTRTLKAP